MAALLPAAKYPLITPENRIRKPTTAMAPAASQALPEHSVPSTTRAAPDTASIR